MTTEIEAHQSVLAANRAFGYRPDIDGMRAVAVLMVLIFHFSLLPQVTGGFLGVDIFFVISGFLITTIVTQQLDSARFRLRTFYLHRIRRLAPALFVVLFGVMGVGVFCLFPNGLIDLSKQILAAQFFYANIYYWRNVNYFGLVARDLPLLHTWSLAAEEQFYLFFPALLLILHKLARKHYWLALTFVMLMSFCLNVFFVESKPEAAFYLFPTRAWELLLGAVLPQISTRWVRSQAIDELIGLIGVGLLVTAVTCYRANFAIPGYFALMPTLGAACVIISGFRSSPTSVSICLGFPPIVYCGRISYSLYLVHWPVNVFATQLIRAYSLEWRWAMFGLSILLASLIYHLVEDPIRLRRWIPRSRTVLIVYALGLITSVAAFAIVNKTSGLPQRFAPEVVRLASFVNDKPDALSECENTPVVVLRECELGIAGLEPTWLIFGDSHAWATHAVFDRWLSQNNQAGLLLFQHGCPPLTGLHFAGSKDDCFRFNQAVTTFIESHPNFRHIVLVSTWKWPVDGGLENGSGELLTPRESMQFFTERFMRSIECLNSLKREIYVWEPVPGARASVPVELARAAWRGTPSNLEFSLDEYRADNHLFFEALAKSNRWITVTYSPSEIVCATGKCIVEVDGKPLYSDTGHVTNSSADFWVRVLERGKPAH